MFAKTLIRSTVAALSLGLAAPAAAQGLQCVPFARAESGVDIRGNANSWWAQAAGRFERGARPLVGAVLTMPGTAAMPGGHVAVVTKILNEREILISHSNWSPINGRRGQIERDVKAVDVSPSGDWSRVRVWYAPIRALGLRASPVQGFIYPRAVRFADAAKAMGRRVSNDLAAVAASLRPDAAN